MLLVYTGEKRLSSSLHKHVRHSYADGEPGVVGALSGLKRLAFDMNVALGSAGIDGWADVVDKNWANQRKRHTPIANDTVDSLFFLAHSRGAVAGKACEAGGGCCLFLVIRNERSHGLRAVLQERRVRNLEVEYDLNGVSDRRA